MKAIVVNEFGPPEVMQVEEIDKPSPNTPLDSKAAADAGRRVWRVLPSKPLQAATETVPATSPLACATSPWPIPTIMA